MSVGSWSVVAAATVFVASPAAADDRPLPWEVWKTPSVVADVVPGMHTVTVSSADPRGGAFDRHSEDDPRFVDDANGEGVVFAATGAGALTRIWVTQGDGVSADLDPAIRLRIRIDGQATPVVDLTLREFFSGTMAPFEAPMVLDRLHSGGGNISYVPIPFRDGCTVTLVGAERAKIWYQVTAVLLDHPDGVVSFRGTEDLARWRQLLARPATDPWPAGNRQTLSGSVDLRPGERTVVASVVGPDEISGLVFRVPAERLGELRLSMVFDDRETVAVPFPWFFGLPRPSCEPARSLFVGVDQDDAYSYFPMPFRRRAKISVRLSPNAEKGLELRYAVRLEGRPPAPEAGIFSSAVIDVPASNPGHEALVLDLAGRGRLAGLAVTVGGADRRGWSFFEGDEIIEVDGTQEWRGTGVEDFFGGGFYFRDAGGEPRPFTQALDGFSCVGGTPHHPSASLYRLMVMEGPVYNRELRMTVEGGATGTERVRWRGLAWYYDHSAAN